MAEGRSEKPPGAGAKDRKTGQVKARVVPGDKKTFYTDDHRSYQEMPFTHQAVKHGISEYVRNQAHINGIESFWALLKRGYHDTYHHMSPKHLNRYVKEFAGCHNVRDLGTIEQMSALVQGIAGKRLAYRELIG